MSAVRRRLRIIVAVFLVAAITLCLFDVPATLRATRPASAAGHATPPRSSSPPSIVAESCATPDPGGAAGVGETPDPQFDELLRACDEVDSKSSLPEILASLTQRLLDGDARLAERLRKTICSGQGSERARALLCLLLGAAGDAKDRQLLEQTAIHSGEVVDLAALKGLVLMASSWRTIVEKSGSALADFWRGAFFDQQLRLDAEKETARDDPFVIGELTEMNARPPRSTWYGVRARPESDEILQSILSVARVADCESVRVAACRSLPHNAANDQRMTTVFRDTSIPPLVRAIALDSLTMSSSNWDVAASAAETETNPRILGSVAVALLSFNSPRTTPATIELLGRILTRAPDAPNVVERACASLSCLDTQAAVDQLATVARDAPSLTQRQQALGAIASCAVGTQCAGQRVAALKAALRDTDQNTAVVAAFVLLQAESAPALADACKGEIDSAVLTRIRTLAEAPSVEPAKQRVLRLLLDRRLRSGK